MDLQRRAAGRSNLNPVLTGEFFFFPSSTSKQQTAGTHGRFVDFQLSLVPNLSMTYIKLFWDWGSGRKYLGHFRWEGVVTRWEKKKTMKANEYRVAIICQVSQKVTEHELHQKYIYSVFWGTVSNSTASSSSSSSYIIFLMVSSIQMVKTVRTKKLPRTFITQIKHISVDACQKYSSWLCSMLASWQKLYVCQRYDTVNTALTASKKRR